MLIILLLFFIFIPFLCVKKRILKFIRNEKYEKYKELKIKKIKKNSWGWKLDQWLSITYKIEFGVFLGTNWGLN